MPRVRRVLVKNSFSFSRGGSKWRYTNVPDSAYEHLFDGDVYLLVPGSDFGTVGAFRVRLHRMSRARGLRYATRIIPATADEPAYLAMVIYRERPGDLFEELHPGEQFEDLNPEDGFQGPSPAQ